jgi:poly(3-hydroxybutyrate) depolymerase
VQSLSIDVGGSARTFVLSVPESYAPPTPLDLVFAWHGLGGSGAGARGYFGLEQQAGGAAIFVYPDGLVVDAGDTGWNLELTGPDIALYDALRASIEADYCIERSRVFSTGHSFGGYMTNTLGCARGGELRAIAPVAGGGPWGGCEPAPLSAFVVHGANDTVVDPAEGQASLEHWRSQASCSDTSQPIEPAGCVEYQACASSRVVFCSHEEGHNWPTLAPAGVWGFFAAQ